MVALVLSAALFAGEVDLFGQPVAPQLHGRPVLVLFSNDHTRETTTEAGSQLALRLHDVPYVSVVRVDLRGLASFFSSIATHEMKDAYEQSVQRTRTLYRDAGLPPPKSLGHTLVFIPDRDGHASAAVGLPKGFTEGLALVLAPDGHEVARAPFPSGVKKIEAALRAVPRRARTKR